jgi:hypothetical protein
MRVWTLEDRKTGLRVGKIYRLPFPGIAARVIEPPAKNGTAKYPYLVESLILRSRWWVNERGEPDNIHSPRLIVLGLPMTQTVRYPAENRTAKPAVANRERGGGPFDFEAATYVYRSRISAAD